jgi:hypothetical protein
MPIAHRITIPVMNPIMRRTTPRMIKGGSSHVTATAWPAWTGKASTRRVRIRTRRTCCRWSGQQRVTPGVPGMLTPARERRHAAGVDELQAGQIDGYLWFADRGKRSRNAGGTCNVQLAAQRDDNVTAVLAQIHA